MCRATTTIDSATLTMGSSKLAHNDYSGEVSKATEAVGYNSFGGPLQEEGPLYSDLVRRVRAFCSSNLVISCSTKFTILLESASSWICRASSLQSST